jgi:deoxyribodipyrimidine photolyase-like uncharacterized protein
VSALEARDLCAERSKSSIRQVSAAAESLEIDGSIIRHHAASQIPHFLHAHSSATAVKQFQATAADDKKLKSTLQKLSARDIPTIEEVNLFHKDGHVIHFVNPKVRRERHSSNAN